jgi:type II secretory ATPase GspE/PulE/Tfp pilus assembly ATPase PilB-like protein/ActR/RegA family two-component response regulator
MSSHGFVGDLLLRAGVVDAAGLALAREVQAKETSTLGRALAGLGLAEETSVAAAIATALHLEYFDGDLPQVDPAVVALLPAAFCRQRGLLPLGFDKDVLRLAVKDPTNYAAIQDTEFRVGKKAVAVVVTETWFETLFRKLYSDTNKAASYDMLNQAKPEGEVEAASEYYLVDPSTLAKDVQLPPIVKLVNLILSDAAKAGASDIHIEPRENQMQVRQRVDGQLHDVLTIPTNLQDATLSRLKIMSGIDISERRKPQDGRSRLRFEGRRIDLRVATLPTQFGEKIVIRLLNTDQTLPKIDQIGFAPENLRLMQSFLSQSQGMILVTGPTGSGKTSTLYTALTSIRSSSNNIITLEDPIEMQIPGVNQMQINVKAGVTFATGLRSVLRQDPNVILVGEIRDRETADIAFGAAQTGHLLLSTLHTNDATATITRLLDLGIQPFLLSSSLLGIVAQRLVRRPCSACAVRHEPTAEAIDRAGGPSRMPADAHWVAGPGCEQCGHTGTKGRMAIHEVLNFTDEIRDLISSRSPEHTIKKAAVRAGMKTLLEDGVAKAAQGLTTLDEVLRVVSHGTALERADLPAAGEPAGGAAGAPEVAVSGGRVLVVEDSNTIAEVVRYFLQLEGFEVLVAPDGLTGLEMAFRERPDIIVTDINMPGMDGVEMVKLLRSDARTAGVRILMLTSEASVESETAGLAAGADDYIVKPVEPRRLAARVKKLRAGSRATA